MRTCLYLLVAALGLAISGILVQAEDYTYVTNNGTITITGYIGPGGDVTIPDQISGLPVTMIAYSAFTRCHRLTSVTIPDSVISIESGDFEFSPGGAFSDCRSLTNVAIGNSVLSIGGGAFAGCTSLSSVTIPNSVTEIQRAAFASCTGLTEVTIPAGVTALWEQAFCDCPNVTGIYFQGDAPFDGGYVFLGNTNATVYYLPGTSGWGGTFSDRPAVLWNPSPRAISVQANRLGFNIIGTPNIPLVVEASVGLSAASWTALQTCTLTNGSIYFSDANWTNHPSRFYRIRSP